MTYTIGLKYFRINKTLKRAPRTNSVSPGLKYFRINKTLKHRRNHQAAGSRLKYFRINKTLKPQILTVSIPRQGC